MKDQLNPLAVFACAFGLSAFAGLGALLRAGKEVNKVMVLSSILNSGFLGLAVSLIWYTKYQENIYFLIGLCILLGLGGSTILDYIIESIKSGGISLGGFNLSMKPKESDKDSGQKDDGDKPK